MFCTNMLMNFSLYPGTGDEKAEEEEEESGFSSEDDEEDPSDDIGNKHFYCLITYTEITLPVPGTLFTSCVAKTHILMRILIQADENYSLNECIAFDHKYRYRYLPYFVTYIDLIFLVIYCDRKEVLRIIYRYTVYWKQK